MKYKCMLLRGGGCNICCYSDCCKNEDCMGGVSESDDVGCTEDPDTCENSNLIICEGESMTTIKGLKQLKRHLSSDGYNVSMLDDAIKALEDQLKYEAALYEMSKNVQTCYRCKHEEDSPNCARNNGRDESICLNGHVDYYKNKFGLDGGTNV